MVYSIWRRRVHFHRVGVGRRMETRRSVGEGKSKSNASNSALKVSSSVCERARRRRCGMLPEGVGRRTPARFCSSNRRRGRRWRMRTAGREARWISRRVEASSGDCGRRPRRGARRTLDSRLERATRAFGGAFRIRRRRTRIRRTSGACVQPPERRRCTHHRSRSGVRSSAGARGSGGRRDRG